MEAVQRTKLAMLKAPPKAHATTILRRSTGDKGERTLLKLDRRTLLKLDRWIVVFSALTHL
jgi:hypothetical protein